MRLRNNPKAVDILQENSDFVVNNSKEYKGKWNTLFGNDNPIYIEVGMGKGDFIYGHAKRNPNCNYIGIEKYPSVQAIACKKIIENGILDNLKLISIDAIELVEVFEKGEVKVLYLNFSDPWPKSRHAKRRLTSSTFLPVYQNILHDDGHIEFKTDNRLLFEYSLVSLQQYGIQFDKVYLDLHNSDAVEDNIMTEYETKFCSKGPIYKFEGRYKNG